MTGWPRMQARRVFRVVNGGTPTSGPENWDGEVPWATPVDLAKVNGWRLSSTDRTLTAVGLASGSGSVPPGSLIVSTRAPIGYVAEATVRMAFNQGCRGLAPTTALDSRYFRYQFSSMATRLKAAGQGSTFVELSGGALAATEVVVPPVRHQRAIADFLDAETARIDALLTKKRRLIELLDERLISERERLIGEQPGAHWTVLGRFVSSITQGVSPQASNAPASGDEWGLLKLSAVKGGRFLPQENKALPAEFTFDHRLVPRRGDLLVTRSNTPLYVGDACAVTYNPGRVVLCDLIYRLRLRDGLLPEFAAQVLLTQRSRSHLSSNARGTSQSMVKLRGEDIKACPVPILSNTRQRQILSAFETVVTLSTATRAKLVLQIDLLVEHRQALITAAVTGELVVPGVAA